MHSAAETEYLAAYAWYYARSKRAARRFEAAVDATMNFINDPVEG
jgi:hypothetical protein